jgi:heme-degrading monooxygenase HmoA
MMFARVTIATTLPGKQDDILRIERDSIVPACAQQRGFKGLYLLHDRKTNKGLTMTLWETEADMRAAEISGFYQQQVAKVKDVLAAPPVREEYEVVLAP